MYNSAVELKLAREHSGASEKEHILNVCGYRGITMNYYSMNMRETELLLSGVMMNEWGGKLINIPQTCLAASGQANCTNSD